MNFRTVVQLLSLCLFLFLLWLAAYPLVTWVPADLFLRLDPLVFSGTLISSRQWIWALVPGLIIVGLTLVLGRFFCGYICPMGVTIDLSDRFFRIVNKDKKPFFPDKDAKLRKIKYFVLFFVLGAGLFGVSLVFTASPLSLITRLYGLVVYPALVLMGDIALDIFLPLNIMLGLDRLAYMEVQSYLFASQWFIVLFFIAVFALVYYSPRFWCRYICPSGALMALFGRKPLVRRKVSNECTDCGTCRKSCPMGAIDHDPFNTFHHECVACETCVRVCPEKAITFGLADWGKSFETGGFIPARREIMASALSGAGAAVLVHTGIGRVGSDFIPGSLLPDSLIRPPGALPEDDFQARCISCGLCMKSCPTNTLQPIWFEAGPGGMFSPKMLPRRGPCDPLCNVCGLVCPTGAIRSLSLGEKMWAKAGTSSVIKHKCLAWEWDRECLVCYEVCPYAAIELKRVPDIKAPVPFITSHKCSGCGACEYHCPVQGGSAIVVGPMEALRMNKGSYIEKGRAIGLELEADPDRERKPPDYLFDPDDPDDLPPGFSF